MPDLSAMLEQGPVICAEGYLFECERRGYLQAGAFVPEVVLDHPEVVEGLHREFVHAGSDAVNSEQGRTARFVVGSNRLHEQQLRALKLPVLLRRHDGADDPGDLHQGMSAGRTWAFACIGSPA